MFFLLPRYANVIIEEGVKVAETAGSNPKKWIGKYPSTTLVLPWYYTLVLTRCYLAGKFKDAGLLTIHKCVAIRSVCERAGRCCRHPSSTLAVPRLGAGACTLVAP